MVVDGGPTQVGVESTVLDLSQDPPVILRPGAVGIEMLRTVLPDIELRQPASRFRRPLRSPGLMSKHYAPRAPVTVYEGDAEAALSAMAGDARAFVDEGKTVAVLAFAEDAALAPRPRCVSCRSAENPNPPKSRPGSTRRCASATTWARMSIVARMLTTDHPLGAAIRDRLRRAAAGRIVQVED